LTNVLKIYCYLIGFFGLIVVNSISQSIIQIDLFRENNWRNKFDKVINDGFVGVDFVEIIRTVIAPILIPLSIVVVFPSILSRNLEYVSDDIILQEYVYRATFVLIFVSFILFVVIALAIKLLPKLQQTIVDEYYLVGRRLHNYMPAKENNDKEKNKNSNNNNKNSEQQDVNG